MELSTQRRGRGEGGHKEAANNRFAAAASSSAAAPHFDHTRFTKIFVLQKTGGRSGMGKDRAKDRKKTQTSSSR